MWIKINAKQSQWITMNDHKSGLTTNSFNITHPQVALKLAISTFTTSQVLLILASMPRLISWWHRNTNLNSLDNRGSSVLNYSREKKSSRNSLSRWMGFLASVAETGKSTITNANLVLHLALYGESATVSLNSQRHLTSSFPGYVCGI